MLVVCQSLMLVDEHSLWLGHVILGKDTALSIDFLSTCLAEYGQKGRQCSREKQKEHIGGFY